MDTDALAEQIANSVSEVISSIITVIGSFAVKAIAVILTLYFLIACVLWILKGIVKLIKIFIDAKRECDEENARSAAEIERQRMMQSQNNNQSDVVPKE